MNPTAVLLYYNQVNPALAGIKFRGVDLCEPEDIIEYAGRWDYGEKNAQKLGQKSKYRVAKKLDATNVEVSANGLGLRVPVTEYEEQEMPIIQKYLAMGHESMIEMGDATFFIECSRVVSHELVRHRMASYQQESQRFTSYKDEKVEDLFFMPPEFLDDETSVWEEYEDPQGGSPVLIDEGVPVTDAVEEMLSSSKRFYEELMAAGIPKQIARYILPNAMRTRLIMKANVREWRHICRLRLDKSAQPEMRELMQQIYDQLVEIYPNAMHGVLDGERGVR